MASQIQRDRQKCTFYNHFESSLNLLVPGVEDIYIPVMCVKFTHSQMYTITWSSKIHFNGISLQDPYTLFTYSTFLGALLRQQFHALLNQQFLLVVQLGQDAPRSATAFADQILDMLLQVLVQDALHLAPLYPRNRVHAFLLADQEFRGMLAAYKACLASGVSHCNCLS